MIRVPLRYQTYFKSIDIENPSITINTSVGLRHSLMNVWKCNLCGKEIKPNNAAAQSHIVKHTKLK